MKVFAKCPYFDCGWCYLQHPEASEANQTNGECHGASECEVYKRRVDDSKVDRLGKYGVE